MSGRMTQIASALYDFWSSFGMPAFPEGSVPEKQALPYITYHVTYPEWKEQSSTYATVWTHSPSYVPLAQVVDQIEETIGEGVQLDTDDGFLMLYKDRTFMQIQPQEDINIKAAYLSLIIEADL